jgi:hypothetical protein
MKIETVAIVGVVFAVTALAALTYNRRMDVLHGPSIEGRAADEQANKLLVLAPALVDHFRWKTRSMIYLTSIIAC